MASYSAEQAFEMSTRRDRYRRKNNEYFFLHCLNHVRTQSEMGHTSTVYEVRTRDLTFPVRDASKTSAVIAHNLKRLGYHVEQLWDRFLYVSWNQADTSASSASTSP